MSIVEWLIVLPAWLCPLLVTYLGYVLSSASVYTDYKLKLLKNFKNGSTIQYRILCVGDSTYFYFRLHLLRDVDYPSECKAGTIGVSVILIL
jgi:hypothetical protein